jgi:hypothetical protein
MDAGHDLDRLPGSGRAGTIFQVALAYRACVFDAVR